MPSVSGNVGAVASVSSVFGRNGGVVAANGDYSGVVAAHLTGATAATRYVGGTASGAPVAGTFAVGDFVVEQTGKVYVCTVAGTPGTWVAPGGSSPSTWVGPYAIAAADYNPALGSGWDGILVEDALPSGMLLLGVAFIVDVVFVNTSTVVIYAGTLAGNDYGTSPVSSGTNVYDGQPQRAGFSVGTQPAGAGVLLTGADVSQVWIDSFAAPPPSGSGRLWLNLVTADLPA